MSKKQREPRDHPGQKGLTPEIEEDIKQGALQDDIDEFVKAGKKLADVTVLQMRVALKSGVWKDRINALEAAAHSASSLGSDIRRFLSRIAKT